MKATRRFGFILFILLLGIVIGHLQLRTILLIICPLLVLWLILWDDKRFHQAETKQQEKLSHFDIHPSSHSNYYHYE
ncbi:MAG TPA: hypothetical protein H9829_11770 [Candidatus Tetragenococcus pullicola]|nr:hypothetical protein [Candidatus Tetragenococcus pullicola]